MADFSVSLKDHNGKLSEIKISAKSVADARRIAARRGVVVRVSRSWFSGLRSEKLSIADRFVLLQRLSAMIRSKIGVSEALRIIHNSFTGAIGRVAGKLYTEIEHGRSLVDAMEAVGRTAFPEAVVSIIRTGSSGGDLPAALRKAAEMERDLEQIKKQGSKGIWAGLFGFTAGVATLLASVYYVAPMVMESDLMDAVGGNVDIGWVMTIATVMSYFAMVCGLAVLVFMIFQILRPFMPVFVDKAVAQIPYYRDLLSARRNFTSFYAMSVLISSGIRIEEALRLSHATAPKGAVKEDFARACKAVSEGKPWADVMETLHPTDRASLKMSQDRSQIADTAGAIAEQYQALFKQRIEILVPVLQLIAAIFLALAGFVLFGVVFMPLLQVMNTMLSGGL